MRNAEDGANSWEKTRNNFEMECDLYWTQQNSDYVVELIFSSYKFGCLPSTFLLIQEINKVALLEGSNIIDLVNDNGYKKIFY